MKRLLKEPLLHFLVLGALLFGAYAWVNRGASAKLGNAARPVRITTNDVAWLTETWTRQRQRGPTREELRGLVTEFLKEELLAREARAMGLDDNDLIVRRPPTAGVARSFPPTAMGRSPAPRLRCRRSGVPSLRQPYADPRSDPSPGHHASDPRVPSAAFARPTRGCESA